MGPRYGHHYYGWGYRYHPHIGSWMTATLSIVAACFSFAISVFLYRSYYITNDKRLMLLASAFLVIGVGSLVDTVIWLGVIPNISWIFYSIGYALLIYVYTRKETNYYVVLLASLGPAIAGVLGILASFYATVSASAGLLLMALSHFIDSILPLAEVSMGQRVYVDVLAVAASFLRVLGLNIFLIQLIIGSRGSSK